MLKGEEGLPMQVKDGQQFKSPQQFSDMVMESYKKNQWIMKFYWHPNSESMHWPESRGHSDHYGKIQMTEMDCPSHPSQQRVSRLNAKRPQPTSQTEQEKSVIVQEAVKDPDASDCDNANDSGNNKHHSKQTGGSNENPATQPSEHQSGKSLAGVNTNFTSTVNTPVQPAQIHMSMAEELARSLQIIAGDDGETMQAAATDSTVQFD